MALRHRLVIALMAFLGAPTMVSSQCRPQHLADVPINIAQGLPIVSVTVAHHEALLIFDTGAERTVLSPDAAQRLGLKPRHDYPRKVKGLSGAVDAGTVDVPFTAAGILLPNHGVLVSSLSLGELAQIVTPDGLLGADIISSFDVALDLPRFVVRLYENRDCTVDGPAWDRPYTTISANRSLHDRLFFWVTIDGHRVAAIFDSGAQHSIIDERSAAKAGVDAKTLMGDPVSTIHGVNAEASSHLHRFAQLSIGNETLAHPTLLVAKLDLVDADLILGADYLASHRVWLSYGSHQIFIGRSP
jgi:predicted aspartyl protease